jgi:hypothetical protein
MRASGATPNDRDERKRRRASGATPNDRDERKRRRASGATPNDERKRKPADIGFADESMESTSD